MDARTSRLRAFAVMDEDFLGVDPQMSSADAIAHVSGFEPPAINVVWVRFVVAPNMETIWAYCECGECGASSRRFFPSIPALVQHLNAPHYPQEYVQWGTGSEQDALTSVSLSREYTCCAA